MIVIDTADARMLAAFWQAALEASVIYEDDTYVILRPPGDGPVLGLQNVPEPRAGKNRLHVDLHAEPGQRHAEAQRLVGLGARILEERSLGESTQWITMVDPEGNEFCVSDHA